MPQARHWGGMHARSAAGCLERVVRGCHGAEASGQRQGWPDSSKWSRQAARISAGDGRHLAKAMACSLSTWCPGLSMLGRQGRVMIAGAGPRGRAHRSPEGLVRFISCGFCVGAKMPSQVPVSVARIPYLCSYSPARQPGRLNTEASSAGDAPPAECCMASILGSALAGRAS